MATTRVNYASGTYGTDTKYLPIIQTLDRMAGERRVLFPQFCQVRSDKAKSLRYISEDPLSFGTALSTLSYSGSEPSGDPAEQASALSPHTLNVAEALFAKDVTFTWRDLDLDADLLPSKMEALVDMWGRHMDALGAQVLAGSFATNTVPDGNGSTCYFFAAAGAGHINKASGEQVNKGTTALNGASLSAAKTTIWAWTDNRSEPLDLYGTQLVLVVPPALGDLAISLTGAGPTDIYTTPLGGTAGATRVSINAHSGINVVVNPYLTDANDWFLVPTGPKSPFVAWVEAPEFKFNDANGRTGKLQATYQAKFFALPPTVTTAFGASVA